MSVINQMLNDLDKRKAGESGLEQHPYNAPLVSSGISKKVFFAALVVIVLLIAAIGYLLLERKSTVNSIQGAKQELSLAVSKKSQTTPKQNVPVASVEQKNPQQGELAQSEVLPENHNAAEDVQPVINTAVTHTNGIDSPLSPEAHVDAVQSQQSEQASNGDIGKVSDENITAVNQVVTQLPASTQPKPKPEAKPKLSIKRAELSPEEIAAIKVSDATKATNRGELEKASQLLEQALVLQPNHIEAREQLSALWYAKKDYKGAVNLLKQGIMLVPEYGEFRLLLARIFVELERYTRAFNTLEQKPEYADADYQSLRASLAQQLGEHDSAMSAYRYLIKHQGEQGRWWLGLAIAADQQGNIDMARQAYNQAIARGNISSQSLSFAKKRIIQLGE